MNDIGKELNGGLLINDGNMLKIIQRVDCEMWQSS